MALSFSLSLSLSLSLSRLPINEKLIFCCLKKMHPILNRISCLCYFVRKAPPRRGSEIARISHKYYDANVYLSPHADKICDLISIRLQKELGLLI
jgi:hypothetical protein